ncbi:hypothetical protein ACHWQZ_G012542 [Mnemiopsis leidyi]
MGRLLAVLCILLAIVSGGEGSDQLESVDNVAVSIGVGLDRFMGRWFDVPSITKIYSTQSYDTFTGSEILQNIRKNVTKQFEHSEKVLKSIRKSALESFYNYTGDTEDFDFLERFRYITHKGHNMSYYKTPNFKRKVSVSNSSVVIPTDVYYNWPEVRETILWTANMDRAFKANWSPNLTGSATTLQYIGTPHGVMRTYPSYYTPRVGKWVTYDHRFRIWYAVGAVESKKVVFLMDMSGTLAVRSGKLMREMAVNLIKTIISDEDYISVLPFKEKVEPICCGAEMVRARSRIKNILIEQIRNIKPQGAANLTEAIRTGIEVLNNSRNLDVCHSTLILFTDYTQRDIVNIFKSYNIEPSVKIVIMQVGQDVLFASDLREAAAELNGFHAQIEDMSDISPTILKLTSQLYTSVVDDDDLQVKSTPMYRDASTEEYITTLVVPVVTTKPANWTRPSSLQQHQGSFLGVAAVDIEAKSLGQYPLSIARGCYTITVDQKGSVLYHPVLYKVKEGIEFDQKLHLYSYLNDGATMKRVEQGMVFQNFSEPAEMLYVEVSDSSVSKKNRSFANKYFFNVLAAINGTTSLLHICSTQTLAFPGKTNVQKKPVKEVLPTNLGPQLDMSRDTAYCSYSTLTLDEIRNVTENETVEEFISRKWQFPECHGFAYEIFDDIYMVSRYLSRYLETKSMLSVTTAAGNRFKVTQENKLVRTNSPSTRDRYTRLISLVTNSKNTAMLSVTDVSTSDSKIFELSRVIYHEQSNSYPLMVSVRISGARLKDIIEESLRQTGRDYGGSRYLVDENGFIVAASADDSSGRHIAKLFPRLMKVLLEKGIFNLFNHTECYFSCEDVYPENTIPVRSRAESLSQYLHFSTLTSVGNLLLSAVSLAANLLSRPLFLFLNSPLSASVLSEPVEDWKSIKIDLTCCQTHPFMARNFSVKVEEGNSLEADSTCSETYKYSSVPDTNLLLVWVWCSTPPCTCQGPHYNLDTISGQVLNPCSESDENYNPVSHCREEHKQEYSVQERSGTNRLSVCFVFLLVVISPHWTVLFFCW